MLAGSGDAPDLLDWETPYVMQAASDKHVGLVLDPSGHAGIGGTAVRRIVLEATIPGRIVRRFDDDTIGKAVPASERMVIQAPFREELGR